MAKILCIATIIILPLYGARSSILPASSKGSVGDSRFNVFKLIPEASTINFIHTSWIEDCGFTYSDEVPAFQLSNPQVVLSTVQNVTDFQSYFRHEWSTDELKLSFKAGSFKFTSSKGLHIFKDTDFNEKHVGSLLWNRLLRPHLSHVVVLVCQNEFRPPDQLISKFAHVQLVQHVLVGESLKMRTFRNDVISNRKFTVAVTDAAHFVSFKAAPDGSYTGRGVEYAMLEAFATTKNLTYVLNISTGSGTGSKLPNGTWVGTAGDVFRGTADFGISLGISIARQAVIDPTTVFEYTRLTFVYKKPLPESRWEAIIWPFDLTVWIATIVATALTLLITYLLFKNYCGSNAMSKSFEIIVSILLEESQEYWNCVRLPWKVRSFLLLWAFVTLLLGTAYKSQLVSFLTFPYADGVPDTFSELANAPNYRILFKFYGGVAYNSFSKSPSKDRRDLFDRFEIERNPINCVETVVVSQKTVCIVYIEAARFLIASNYTLEPTTSAEVLGTANEYGLLVPLIWAFPKASPLTAKFSAMTSAVSAAGLYKYWANKDLSKQQMMSKKWFTASNNTVATFVKQLYRKMETRLRPLEMRRCMGTVALFTVGLLASGIIVLVEVVTKVGVTQKIKRLLND